MDRMPDFLRKLSPVMLNAYCKQKNIAFHVEEKEKNTDKIQKSFIDCWERLDYTLRNEVEIDFGIAQELMTHEGCLLLHTLATTQGKDVPKEWDDMAVADKALWFYLNDPDTFKEAAVRYAVEHTDGWTAFRAGVSLPVPGELAKKIVGLQQELQKYLYVNERRGAICKIDVINKEKYTCFVANPQNYPKRENEYNEKTGELSGGKNIKPIFQIFFLYRADDQTLSIKARYKKQKRQDLANIFGDKVLSVPLLGNKLVQYNIERFLENGFEMTKPLGLEKVVLKSIRLNHRNNLEHVLQIDLGSYEHGINPLREKMSLYHINPFAFEVSMVKMTFYFEKSDEQNYKHERRDVTVEISMPHRCTLKTRELDDKAMAILRTWQIVH